MPNEKGFYGDFGGSFLPPELQGEFAKIEKAFHKLIDDKKFNDELDFLLKTYAGRPSPVSFARRYLVIFLCARIELSIICLTSHIFIISVDRNIVNDHYSDLLFFPCFG